MRYSPDIDICTAFKLKNPKIHLLSKILDDSYFMGVGAVHKDAMSVVSDFMELERRSLLFQ